MNDNEVNQKQIIPHQTYRSEAWSQSPHGPAPEQLHTQYTSLAPSLASMSSSVVSQQDLESLREDAYTP